MDWICLSDLDSGLEETHLERKKYKISLETNVRKNAITRNQRGSEYSKKPLLYTIDIYWFYWYIQVCENNEAFWRSTIRIKRRPWVLSKVTFQYVFKQEAVRMRKVQKIKTEIDWTLFFTPKINSQWCRHTMFKQHIRAEQRVPLNFKLP